MGLRNSLMLAAVLQLAIAPTAWAQSGIMFTGQDGVIRMQERTELTGGQAISIKWQRADPAPVALTTTCDGSDCSVDTPETETKVESEEPPRPSTLDYATLVQCLRWADEIAHLDEEVVTSVSVYSRLLGRSKAAETQTELHQIAVKRDSLVVMIKKLETKRDEIWQSYADSCAGKPYSDSDYSRAKQAIYGSAGS